MSKPDDKDMRELYLKYVDWVDKHLHLMDIEPVTKYVEALQDIADGIEGSPV